MFMLVLQAWVAFANAACSGNAGTSMLPAEIFVSEGCVFGQIGY